MEKEFKSVNCRDGPWPDSTQAYFWPVVNKGMTRLWPGYFLTQPNEIWKIWDFIGKFSNTKPKPMMADPTQPEQKKIDPIRVKKFWPGPIIT